MWLVQSERERARLQFQQQLERLADDFYPLDALSLAVFPPWQQRRELPPAAPSDIREAWERLPSLAKEERRSALVALESHPQISQAWSPSGLPYAVLVNHALWKLNGEPAEAAKVLRLVLAQANPLSGKMLAEIAPSLTGTEKRAAEVWGKSWDLAQNLGYSQADAIHWKSISTNGVGHPETNVILADGSRVLFNLGLFSNDMIQHEMNWQRLTGATGTVKATVGSPPPVAGFSCSRGLIHYFWHTPSLAKNPNEMRLLGGLTVATVATTIAMWLVWKTLRRQTELSRLQTDFVASVSHELRTPVASIGVLAQRLENAALDTEKSAHYRRWIAREGHRLAGLVDNILDFTRLEQNRKHYEPEALDLPKLVQEAVDVLQPFAEEKGLELLFTSQWAGDTAEPEFDPEAMRQVLVNLVENSRNSPHGAVVSPFP